MLVRLRSSSRALQQQQQHRSACNTTAVCTNKKGCLQMLQTGKQANRQKVKLHCTKKTPFAIALRC
jgi:hypothetical protein